MNRLVVVKRLGPEALRRLDNLRYRARRLQLFQGHETHLNTPGKRIYGRISMGDPSGTQRQISSISKFVTPMHPSDCSTTVSVSAPLSGRGQNLLLYRRGAASLAKIGRAHV